MEKHNSGMTGNIALGEIEQRVYEIVLEKWPATPIEVAIQLKEKAFSREEKRRASTKYTYYLKKLVEKKFLLSKKSGNTLIVWPLMAEKYRAIHEIITKQEKEHVALLTRRQINKGENNA